MFRSLIPLAVVAATAASVVAAPAGNALSFNRDIRPILSENCFQCHGPDKHHRKADLRLDVREVALDALAIVPGKPDDSELVQRIFSTDEDEHMPPAESNRTLTDAQKQTLKRWIAEGAVYQPHWAYVVPERPPVPDAPAAAPPQTGSAPNPIDAFIRATLAREKLAPAPEADRRTLIRRLSLDLTGLPPAAQDVEAFAASRDPRAYEKLVRQYLASPHFGERLAIHWLDLVRFADTVGFHNDVEISTWPYRDYVIKAFNDNLPYDQFTREQLAGDLLPNSTVWQRVGSAYNRLHRISAEGGIQDKEYYAKYAADRVRTIATVWMGSTMACCECHDHKFDPFSTKDFYRLEAVFSDLKEKGAYNLSGGFTRENLTEETIFPNPAQAERAEKLDAEIARLNAELKGVKDQQLAAGRSAWAEKVSAFLQASETPAAAVAAREASAAGASDPVGGGSAGMDEPKYPTGWKVQKPSHAESGAGATLTIQDDDKSVLAGGKNPINDTYTVTIPAPLARVAALRLEVVSDPHFAGDEVARSGSTFYLSEIDVGGTRAGASSPMPIQIASAHTGGSTEFGHPIEAVVDGDAATTVAFARKKGGAITLLFAQPWAGGPGATLTVHIRHSDRHPYQNLGRFKLALHGGEEPDVLEIPAAVAKALSTPASGRKPTQKREIATYYRTIAPELAGLRAQLTAATNERNYLIDSLPSVPVSKSVEPRTIRVLARGNWMDDSGDIVEPGAPAFLRQIVPRDGKRVSRLDFADWLVAPDNPLTARTFVNRLWRIYFGAGLVRTLEDLGSQGEWPTHPELLDWLAVEFRESGWNIKHLIELLVTSQTYRQSAEPSAAAEEHDPTNRFLAHQNRFRLEAELVRDNALAISGLLVPTVGGPSVHPYQPEGYYAPLNFPKREYVPDIGEGLWRRGVYTHWQRTFLLPSFVAFDAPSRDECTANRSTSNTPLQALTLLNDPTFVEAARAFAAKIVHEGGRSTRDRLDWAYRRALARPPRREEARLLQGLIEKQTARYRDDASAARALVATGSSRVPSDLAPAELAAWTAVARAILNLHETITRM